MNDDHKNGEMSSNGTMYAYLPEYFGIDKEWHSIPTRELKPPLSATGMPKPRGDFGLLSMTGLFGYEQAWALAWQFAAQVASDSFNVPKIRITSLKLQYSVSAKFHGIMPGIPGIPDKSDGESL